MRLTVDKFIPGDAYLLVTRVQADAKTAGGIVMPDVAKTVRNWGVVEQGRDNVADRGDVVAFPAYAAKPIEFDDQPEGVEYLLIETASILGRIPGG